jgi:uncharacterized protein YdaU (DUF1376 family)
MPTAKSTKSPAFQFYPKDFLSSTKVARMSLTERGIYITLLSVQWMEGALPSDLSEIADIVGITTAQLTRIWPKYLGRCFVEKNGHLINERLERERKVQSDFRKKQKANADKRWDKSGNATALPEVGLSHDSGNALLPLPQSASASPSALVHTQGRGAPLHQSHKAHASCGRVCVPADLHSEFVRSLNTDDADKVLRAWYLVVDDEWSAGDKKHVNTGGNNFAFWRAWFSEQWPAPDAGLKRVAGSRLPEWLR